MTSTAANLEGYRAVDPELTPQDTPDAPNELASLGQIVREPAEPGEEANNEPPLPTLAKDPRTDIYARFKAKRDAESTTTEAFDPNAMPVDAQMPGRTPAAPPTAVEPPADGVRPAPSAAPAPDGKRFNLRVNRNDFEVSREDLIRHAGLSAEEADGIPEISLVRAAQMNLAAEQRLQDAKFRGGAAAPAPGDTQPNQQLAEQTFDHQPQPGAPAPSRRELIEKIQLGDPEEAEKAFDQMFEERVTAHQRQQQFQSGIQDVNSSLETFARENADIVSNPRAARLHRDIAAEEAIADLAALGLSPTEQLQLQNDHNLAAQAHTAARLQGLRVRSPAEIFGAAADRLRGEYGAVIGQAAPTPQPQQAINPRVEAKRALPPQPPRAGSSPTLSARPVQAAPARDSSATIARMAAARGQRLS